MEYALYTNTKISKTLAVRDIVYQAEYNYKIFQCVMERVYIQMNNGQRLQFVLIKNQSNPCENVQ